MKTMITEAARAGARLGVNTSLATYRRIRTKHPDPMTQAWEMVGTSIRSAMAREPQKARSARMKTR